MWDGTLKQAKHRRVLEETAALWSADPESMQLVSASHHNLLYQMKCNGKLCYLRITHPLIKSREELAASIHYQRYLFETDAPVCAPLPSTRGQDVEEINFLGEFFLAYVNAAVTGDPIHFGYSDKTIYETWGKSLAHLHRAAKNYSGEKHQFLHSHDMWEEIGRLMAEEDKIVRQEYAAVDEWLAGLSKNTHDFGLIHGDHRAQKVFYDGSRVSFLDSSEPMYHWFWADVVRPFLDLNKNSFQQWKVKLRWFLDGYETILPFAPEWVDCFPWFVRMQNLEKYAWMRGAPGTGGFMNARLSALMEDIQCPLKRWEF
jgi:Ser/Thr protein kinase RdoA (MazF antagonist)